MARTEEKLPIIAIIGRQNVGKSSLLNAIAGRRLSIVDPMPGVTRDRVTAIVAKKGVPFQLVDTAGMGMAREDQFFESVDRQIQYAIEEADLVLFVVDAIAGLLEADKQVATRLRRAGKAVLLVANKSDNTSIENGLMQFAELGFGDAVPVSCAHMRRMGELLDILLEKLPQVAEREFRPLRVAIVGKRNVGKSTLVNALAGEERVIVSEVPGTTRDAVDVHLRRKDQDVILIDTAGIRRRHKLENSVELFSRARTREAIGRADAVAFMIDVVERVTDVDKRIAGFIEERKKPVAIVLNKWDLVPKKHGPDEFTKYLAKAMPNLDYAPVLVIAAKSGERVWQVLDVMRELHDQSGTRIPTPEVNRVIKVAEAQRSPGTRGARPPKIFYATQTRIHPPSFKVFVNDPRNFTADYQRYLTRRFRELLPFPEVPIELQLMSRRPPRGR